MPDAGFEPRGLRFLKNAEHQAKESAMEKFIHHQGFRAVCGSARLRSVFGTSQVSRKSKFIKKEMHWVS
jgi:hypothetical protein